MNTLNLGYKSQTENPFENLDKYPALKYKGENKVSRFSKSYLTSEEPDEEYDDADDGLIDVEALVDELDESPTKEQLGITKIQSTNPEIEPAKKLDVPRKTAFDMLAKSLPKNHQ